MNTISFKPYLFLLSQPSIEARKRAYTIALELNIIVSAQYGVHALEVKGNPEKIQRLFATGMFKGKFKATVDREFQTKLSKEEMVIVDQWNSRFTASYREIKKSRKHYGKSWGDSKLNHPAPYSKYDPEHLKHIIAEKVSEKDLKKFDRENRDETELASLLEKRFRDFTKDDTIFHNLRHLIPYIDMRHKTYLLMLDWNLIQAILTALLAEESCWRMTGEMSVGIVFVESNQNDGPKFSRTERAEICNEILDGLNWLVDQHPVHLLSWVIDFQFTTINVPNGPYINAPNDPAGSEAYWRDAAMPNVNYFGATYSGDWTGVVNYREDMRVRNFSKHSIAIFVTPYNSNWHAYAGGGRLVLSKHNNWGGWGQGTLDIITSHETSHLFNSIDEYTGSGSPCSGCDITGGCDNIPNGNCHACANPKQDCIMAENQHRLCNYTKGQIGWSHLFLELWTVDVAWAGTDDDVWLDIGDRTYYIDTPDVNDFERGSRIGYAIWDESLRRADIKRVLIRKGPDGAAGGWRLQRVRLIFGGQVICDQSPNAWLEDDFRVWAGCSFDGDIVNSLVVRVTTADVAWAGTDDDVSITLGGRTWNLDTPSDDFERGDTNTFRLDPGTSFYRSNIHSVSIHKSPDGIAGGWKLKGISVEVNGVVIYNNQSINKWLEDNDRNWSDAI